MWVKGNRAISRLREWTLLGDKNTHAKTCRQRAPGKNPTQARVKAKLLGEQRCHRGEWNRETAGQGYGWVSNWCDCASGGPGSRTLFNLLGSVALGRLPNFSDPWFLLKGTCYTFMGLLWGLTLLFINCHICFSNYYIGAGLGCWPVSPKAFRLISFLVSLARFGLVATPSCKGMWENDSSFAFLFVCFSRKRRCKAEGT